MARRKLRMQGRIVAAGLSLGVVGALAGFMAAGDHTADASQPAASNSTGSFEAPTSKSPTSDSPAPRSTTNDFPQYAPQPQTRTGGS